MPKPIDVDVWIRNTSEAQTEHLPAPSADASAWTEADVSRLLTEMLLALERTRNPGGEPPPVSLRGFSWIVSPDPRGVLVHIEMPLGTASAGPFDIAEPALSALIARVMAHASTDAAATTVH